MKKIFFLILASIIWTPHSYATDSCIKIVPQEASFVGKVVRGANIRSYPCTYNSSVVGTAKVGEKFQVISKVDGWYFIKLTNGTTARVWDQAISQTNETIDTPQIIQTNTAVTIDYNFSSKDRILIYKINSRIEKIVRKKGFIYKSKIITILEKALQKLSPGSRKYEIILHVINRTKEIEQESPTTENTTSNYEVSNDTNLSFDINKVRSEWLKWQNTERKNIGVELYSYDSKLDKTAQEWSEFATQRGYISHKRDVGDSFYNYTKIEGWMKDRGVVCKNVNGTTYSESTGAFWFNCSTNDCTDGAVSAAKKTFDYYMSEKGLSNSQNAHYRGITNKDFRKIGLGLDIQSQGGNNYVLYMTTHYCTELQ
ncbi:SH3 domain-containing protein [Candidatus Gracilibacteria bacterium 28_42_T64]|nr:SH3 domain-containing protein [Candidatus Gracilibacteria bacterium 28_42_T64]